MEWLNYHHLLYFWTAVREGGVSKAAERLLLSQPTVSGQIRKLEERIGQDLIDRSGREFALTETGQLVYSYAERIFTVGQELVDTLGDAGAAHGRQLRIGISDALPKLVVCALIEPALAQDPTLKIVCQEDKTERLLADLSLNAFDLVLADEPVGAGSNVRAFTHALGDSGITFFGVSALATKVRKGFPESLSEAPMLLPTPNTTLRRALDRWFDEHGVRPRIAGEFGDSALMKVFGQRGAGVFPSPTIVASEVCRQYRVKEIAPVDEVREGFYAISLQRTLRNPLVVEICEMARETLAGIG